MFVCICNAVKDTEIKQAIAQGYDNIELLKEELDVATCCGGCVGVIESMIDEHTSKLVHINPKLYKEVA